jgi:outer membrane receptor protein involved in Fe transport
LPPTHRCEFAAACATPGPHGGACGHAGRGCAHIARCYLALLLAAPCVIRSSTEEIPVGGEFQGDPEWGGWRITTFDNVGRANLASLEFDYRQNLSFLPGFWKGFAVFANYTTLRYGNPEAFLRPKNLANGGVSLRFRDLFVSWRVNWVPQYRSSALNAAQWVDIRGERLNHDLEVNYRVHPNVTLFVTGRNIFNQSARTYFGPDQNSDVLRRATDYGTIWTAGLRGRF